MIRRLCLLFACMFLLIPFGFAQQGSAGEVTGTIKDASGAMIPGALVVATEQSTNVTTKTTSTSVGVYTLPALPPGVYKITASHEGFSTEETSAITLRVAQVLNVDLKLKVGGGEETVNVTAQSLLSDSAQLDHFVTSKEMENEPIPVTGDGERQLQDFIFKTLPGTTGETYLGSINGGQLFSNEIYIDGVSLGTFDTAEMGPSMDAIGEFNLQAGSMGAQYNGGGTAVSNFNIQSGTNKFHGGLYEYFQNEDLNANSYDAKAQAAANGTVAQRPKQRLNNYGGTLGGPVWIPKIYNGHDKTFFFFSIERTMKRNFVLAGQTTMPTQGMLNGDLSGFLNPALTNNANSGQPATLPDGTLLTDALGRQVIFGQIYDPATSRVLTAGQVDPVTGLTAVSNGLVREPFANNQIPTSRFDSVASQYLKLPFPTDFLNNHVYHNLEYYSPNQPVFNQQVISFKIDEQLTAAHKVSFYMSDIARDRSNTPDPMWAYPGTNPLDPDYFQHNPGKIVRANEYWTIRPTLVNHFAAGYNRFTNIYTSPFMNDNWPSSLGLKNLPALGFPSISFSPTNSALGSLDQFGTGTNGSGSVLQSTVLTDQVSWTHGRHQLQFGTEWRFYNENDLNISGQASYAVSSRSTDDGTSAANYTGNAFASFLLGQVNSTSRTVYAGNTHLRRKEVGTFVQDNWKLNPKLSLNVGLRWEVLTPLTEINGYFTSFEPTLPNPGAGNLPGSLEFASQAHKTTFETTDWGIILPRFGFAYQLTARAIVRGGFGVNSQSPEGNPELQGNYTGGPSTLGYSGAINVNSTSNPQASPEIAPFTLSNPYPSYTQSLPNYDPTQANLGAAGTPYYIRPDGNKPGYSENYTFGFEYDLGRKTVADVNYVGNTTKRIYAYGLDQMNQLPWSDVAKYGDALFDPLSEHPEIPTPYTGFPTSLAVQQAVAPFPQYSGGSIYQLDSHYGWSRYDSLQATITRHVEKGLNLSLAYTWAKMMTNANGNFLYNVQDAYNPRAEKAVAYGYGGLNVPQQFKATVFYDLPVGRGRKFSLPYYADWALGGWTVSANLMYQSGDVLAVSDSSVQNAVFSAIRPNFTGAHLFQKQSGQINVVAGSGPQYLNPAAFASVPTTPGDIALTPGNTPSALSIEGPGLADENLSLQKNFYFGEGRYFQIRADAINAFNRAGRGDPDTNIADSTFGQILNPGTDSQNFDSDSYWYQPRVIQLGARIRF